MIRPGGLRRAFSLSRTGKLPILLLGNVLERVQTETSALLKTAFPRPVDLMDHCLKI
jgi:hypothetical protein